MTGYTARTWDGSSWQPVGTQIADLSAYVETAGDTMSGPLVTTRMTVTDNTIYGNGSATLWIVETGTSTPKKIVIANASATNEATTLGQVRTEIQNHYGTASVAAGSLSWNDLGTTPGMYPALLHGTTNANGPGVAYYYYVTIYVYASTNITQVAHQYSDGGGMWLRSRYSGTWSSWVRP